MVGENEGENKGENKGENAEFDAKFEMERLIESQGLQVGTWSECIKHRLREREGLCCISERPTPGQRVKKLDFLPFVEGARQGAVWLRAREATPVVSAFPAPCGGKWGTDGALYVNGSAAVWAFGGDHLLIDHGLVDRETALAFIDHWRPGGAPYGAWVAHVRSSEKATPTDATNVEGGAHRRVDEAIALAVAFGGVDGAHHKTWVIDQMVRILAGDDYEAIVRDAKAGDDGPDTYPWDEGIAP